MIGIFNNARGVFWKISCVTFVFCLLTTSLAQNVFARVTFAASRVAVLDFGETETGRRAAAKLAKVLARDALQITIVDQAQSRAAASGSGYQGSLNMTLAEARDLGAAIGCDFFVTGNAQTLRRSSSTNPAYYESSANVFFVHAQTGKLLFWENLDTEADTNEAAEAALLNEINEQFAAKFSVAIRRAQEDAQLDRRTREKTLETATETPPFEDVPEENSSAAKDFRAPQPYRRLRPRYTDEAARFEVEAIVDVTVEIDAEGKVRNVDVVRWAGYELDQSVVETVRQLHFRPATRAGRNMPVRVLLRYNFRRPPKEGTTANQ